MAHEYVKENDTFSVLRNGTVPKPTQEEVNAGKVLKADGTWGEGGGGSSTLADLTDVNLSSPSDGQILKYDAENDKWVNDDESGGTVTDVTVDGVSVVNQDGEAEIIMPVKGVNVNGDSVLDANKEAQIKSYKEVTQAEYNALPASKLSDGILYCIKDVGGADSYPPLIYSDEEREVGVWRDGKPLYQKTLYFEGTITKNVWFSHNISDVDLIWIYNSVAKRSTDYRYNGINYVSSDDYLAAWINRTQIYISYPNNLVMTNGYFTVQYTKTTDTPGSGTWTTQGAIAHHYSTDEHIIGAWIDGKPIYEKAIQVTATLRSGDNDISISTPNFGVLVDAWATGKMGNNSWAKITTSNADSKWNASVYDVDSSKVRICLGSSIANRGFSDFYIILQYTKTTD